MKVESKNRTRVLVLGGTSFIGRNLVEALIKQPSLDVTLFNRGISNPELFPGIDKIHGDRENPQDLNRALQHDWQYVIDISAYYPQSVNQILHELNKDIGKYIFISTCSVYDMAIQSDQFRNESAPILSSTIEEETDTTVATYGQRKAACERLIAASNIPYVILRPALVYGPHDQTDRLYYWIHQVKNELELMVPENGMRQLSLTYVIDLVNCILESLFDSEITGIFNCISYPNCSIQQVIAVSSDLFEKRPSQISASASFLREQNISEWTDLPLWLNSDLFTFSNEVIKKRFKFEAIDFSESLLQTIKYYEKAGFAAPKVGLDKTKQNQLMKQLKHHG